MRQLVKPARIRGLALLLPSINVPTSIGAAFAIGRSS